MTDRLFVLNGPNLNMLGRRELPVYGRITLVDIEKRCRELAVELDFEVFFGQSNHEGQLIEWIHRAHDEMASVVINPAGLTTRSVAVYDALRMIERPVAEVHLTNIFGREDIYHSELVTASAADALLAGFGADGYELAIRGVRALLGGVVR